MTLALIDSGLGMLPTAGWLRHLAPGLDLVLLMDPDAMPWGDKSAELVTERVLAAGEDAVRRGARGIVVPCNTASVTALDRLRERFEPGIPVVGTVPAVKPAAAVGAPVAVWATPRTTASEYQTRLIADFAGGVPVHRVACPGLAEAVDRADPGAVAAAIDDAAARTPTECASVVLGCTHYPLVAAQIMARLPVGTTVFDSAEAVARQTLRRLGVAPDPDAAPGSVTVVLSGREGSLPDSALAYPVGRALGAGAAVPAEELLRATTVPATP